MFLERSSATQNESKALKRLLGVFSEAAQGDLFTLDDLVERVHSIRREALAFLLGQLAARHVIDQFATVISPVSHGGIQRFYDVDEIPDEIYDPFQMKEIEVEPSIIRVYFTKHNDKNDPANHGTGGSGDPS